MIKNKLSIFLILLIVLFPNISLASVFSVSETYNLSNNKTIAENLYVIGSNVLLSGKVFSDAIVLGGVVNVREKIGKDGFIAGGTVSVLNGASDDLRMVGGTVFSDGVVGGDLIIIGGNLQILPDTVVYGDALITGGTVNVYGTYNKDLVVTGGEVVIEGKVFGDLKVSGRNIIIKNGSEIKGNFFYSSSKEALIEDDVLIVGKTEYTKSNIPEGKTAGFLAALISFAFIAKLLIMAVSALVVFYLFRNFVALGVVSTIKTPGKSFLIGLVVLIVTPIIGIILSISLIGIMAGLITLLLYITLLLVSTVISPIIAGSWIYALVRKNKDILAFLSWKMVLTGVLALTITSLIPFMGWILVTIVLITSLGTVSRMIYKKFWIER